MSFFAFQCDKTVCLGVHDIRYPDISPLFINSTLHSVLFVCCRALFKASSTAVSAHYQSLRLMNQFIRLFERLLRRTFVVRGKRAFAFTLVNPKPLLIRDTHA